MKCSISNIAWVKEQDWEMYGFMERNGIRGLEIAPSRIWSEKPYEHLQEAGEWKKRLEQDYGLSVVSMQSIWFGRKENMFRSVEEREKLLEYTKRAVDLAHVISCRNIVFGCPKNRNRGEMVKEENTYGDAVLFFQILAEYAEQNDTVIALEANPAIYGTDFLNTTQETLDFLDIMESITGSRGKRGLMCNLDFGTVIENQESVGWALDKKQVRKISHVHISEPGLEIIKKREQHFELIKALIDRGYEHDISIEMKAGRTLEEVKEMVLYLQTILAEITNEKRK